ncbi:MAG: hypothetical protein FJX75_18950 [Armatimonadetes bacterium]|nr:hypothetical protein [Armatimonadota bacterium]
MTEALREAILTELERLPEQNLRALLNVLRGMREGDPPIRRWSAAFGSISDEDAEAMLKAVEEGCERVDLELSLAGTGH